MIIETQTDDELRGDREGKLGGLRLRTGGCGKHSLGSDQPPCPGLPHCVFI